MTQPEIERIKAGIRRLIPEVVLRSAETLGYELYAVGGCVRDPLLGRSITDVDLAVVGDAPRLAQETAKAFGSGQVAIYARFGTAMLMIEERKIEFATARRESYTAESRKPSEVIPVPIEEDLKRRDFTINAIALGLVGSRAGQILDLFDGLADLQRRLLRTPLEPEHTFSDDPLRMLRAIRFAAEYGLTIEERTWQGILNNCPRLKIVAAERIGEEIWRMMAGADPVRSMQLMIKSGMMQELVPEVTNMAGVEQFGIHHHKDVLAHSLKVLQGTIEKSADPVVRLAALLHDVGKPGTKKYDPDLGWTFHGHELLGAKMAWRVGKRLRLGRESLERVGKLIRLHMRPVNLTAEGVSDSALRRLMVETGDDLDDQLLLCRADITTANPKLVKSYLANFEEMARKMSDVEARDRMRQFQSPIRGEEIMTLCGLEPGPEVGALKERIEDAILDGIIPYDYEAAKQFLLTIKDDILNTQPQLLAQERRNRAASRRRITASFKFPNKD